MKTPHSGSVGGTPIIFFNIFNVDSKFLPFESVDRRDKNMKAGRIHCYEKVEAL